MDEIHVEDKEVEKQEIEKKDKQYILFMKKHYQKIFIGIGIFILCLYAFGCFYYQNKFMPRTTLNGISVSGITYENAKQKIQDHINKQTVTLIFNDGEKEILTKENCGLIFNQDCKIKKQNTFLWFTHWFYQDHIEMDNLLNIDNKKLETSLSQLQHIQNKQIAPVDAKVQYKDNHFSIVKETPGNMIEKDILIDKIITAFNNGQYEINVQETGAYAKPKITSNDESLKSLLEAANQYCDVSITYQTITDDIVLDGNTLISWLSIDESGHYYKDDNEFKKQATEFVKTLSDHINIIGKTKTFTGANGRKISVKGGNYGYKLKQEKEVEGLLKDIQNGKKGIRAPITTGIQASYENGGLGKTFIEIDMTQQHFWYHKNGKIILESDIVSGLPSDPNKKTPAGTYYIYFMQLNRTLRGEIQADGKPEYETPVAYWMAFNGGIGLHDATWQSRFGGNVYYTKGSHGCINLPLKVAAELYDMIKVNTPVVCYY